MVVKARAFVLFALVSAFLVPAIPGANAVSLTFELEGHPPNHVMTLPPEGNESGSSAGQLNVPFNVTLHARDFVCLTQVCTVTAEFNIDKNPFPPYYGASFNPGKVTFEVPQAQPGNAEKPYVGQNAIILEVKWNLETRPSNNDQFVYTISLTTEPVGPEMTGTAVPPPAPADYHFTDFPIGFEMANRPPPGQGEICQIDPSDPACQTGAAPPPDDGGKAPGVDFAVLGIVLALSLVLLRRRLE